MTGAEAVGLAALKWVAPVVKQFVSKGISYLGSDIAEGLEELETTLLPQFQLTIQAAQNSTDKDLLDKLAKWLARLKNAYYDAEAILHELEYERLKHRAKGDDKELGEGTSSHSFVQPLVNIGGKVSQKVSMLSPKKKLLLDKLNKLKEIATDAKELRKLLQIQSGNENSAPAGNRIFETTSLLTHKVIGRDKDRDQIINFLLDEQGASRSTQSYSVVAIIGIRGAGKTTLAQYVYNNEKVKNRFGVRMWLCLSENKDVKERTREMIEGVTGQESPNLLSLNNLQNKLIETLPESKSILLVLDDVWYDKKVEKQEQQEKQWDHLLAPFASIGGRCKIMVTSRKKLFPNALSRGKLIPIELSMLADDDFKSLFRYHAMDSLEVNDPQLKNDLCNIGDVIATKMIKSPLAGKVVGNQLRKRPEKSFWQDTLKKDILSSISEVLLWSYQHLDVQLQRCFLFWSVFPKGTYFKDGIDLVRYWVALDFIQSFDIGFEYFSMMVANAMLQLVDGRYYMHDLFRDLAENLLAGDCFRVTNFEKEIPSTTLYAFINVNNKSWKNNLSSKFNSRNLQALILDIGRHNPLENLNKLLPIVCTKFKNLRILVLWLWDLKKLPSVIGDLKNLSFLDVWHSSIEELPDSVSWLYHLQFLILPTSIKRLPPKLSDLIKLRSIVKYDRNYNLVHTLPPIPYLGKLTSLQSLGEFHVRKERGYELRQLGCLREISGSLRIVNLENVRQKEEAVEARLIEKSKLKSLELVWAQSSESFSHWEVIEALQPANDLEDISIKGYMGGRCPSWLLKGSILQNIKCIKFYNCKGLTHFPNFQACHCLTELIVSKCPCLIFLCGNELQLNEIEGTIEENSWLYPYMYNKIELKEVFDHEVESFKKIGCQEHFTIEHATKDSELELTDDVERSWWLCHQLRMNFIFGPETRSNKLILSSMLRILEISFCCISNGALFDCLRGIATLEELHLKGIMTITTLPPAEIMEYQRSLRVLEIRHCWCLNSLGGLHALPNLEKLTLDSCRSLKMRSDHTELPPTLESFIIARCNVSEAVLEGNLRFLRYIDITSCFGLKILSFSHITSLNALVLFNCPGISHIQNSIQRSFIDFLSLVLLPDLNVESVLKSWQGCRRLHISSSAILNKLLLPNTFDAIETLVIERCNEEETSFEQSDHLRSIKTLEFRDCELQNLPSSFNNFPNLESIYFYSCSRITSLPELPKSVQEIEIEDCPELKERCQPNGPEWHKIQYIHDKFIQ